MQINSNDGYSFISLEKHFSSDSDYASFTFQAMVDIGHGRFNAANHDLQFLNISVFINQLLTYKKDDRSIPELEGTYNSRIKIVRNHKNFIVEFQIGDAFCGKLTHDYLFRGSFGIDDEQYDRIIAGFKNICEQKY